ncbi:MAG: DUF488 family protein [Coriobacteriia bacterium]|nr:DUF488 family protein [Coriobacteriia bacterium]MCL2870992.1 DUF488 family protein [Coriobacteriia bacterium]
MPFLIKRIYESAEPSDGKRLLVDRLWPRGVSKERAALDGWLKDIAPSPELRIWFDHQEDRFVEFRQRYLMELNHDEDKQVEITRALALGKEGMVTLLYGARSPEINHAIVLKEFLDSQGT